MFVHSFYYSYVIYWILSFLLVLMVHNVESFRCVHAIKMDQAFCILSDFIFASFVCVKIQTQSKVAEFTTRWSLRAPLQPSKVYPKEPRTT